jgi:hypothetical protein
MKVQNRQQFLIVLTAIAVGLLIGNSLIYEPMSKWWSARQSRIRELKVKVSDGRGLIKSGPIIRGNWEEMRTNTLPTNTSEAEQKLNKALDNWAHATGATISGIFPQWKNDTDDYMTLNCRVEASGNLSVLTQFMYDIERDPMALKLDSVELSAHDNTGQMLTLGLQISGLVLNPQVKR